jgi:hypothetical protein
MSAAQTGEVLPFSPSSRPVDRENSPSSAVEEQAGEPAPSLGRDLRLDFFRGLALLFIFIDHIPFNMMAWLTIHNYGFSDAAEVFIFISGYSAALAYGRVLRRGGFWAAVSRVLRRCWELYVAQVVLLILFTALIAVIVLHSDNDFFAEEMQVIQFFQNPPQTIVQALLLKFRPAFFDILPLYIVMLLAFPVLLWIMERWPAGAFAIAAAVYAVVQVTHVNLPAYPPGLKWNFNPLAWQFLFFLGAFFARHHKNPGPVVPRRPALLRLAAALLCLACSVSLLLLLQEPNTLPTWLTVLPTGKTDLAPLRIIHFFALAYLTVSIVGGRPGFLRWPIAYPVICCGQRSLPVFCAGTLLSLAAHMVLVMVRGNLVMQAVVSFAGIALLLAFGTLLCWVSGHKNAEIRGTGK